MIKSQNGIISLKLRLKKYILFFTRYLGYFVKYIDKGHLKQFAQMEFINNHTDPFDRMIIAQAIAEKIPLISSDQRFPKYKKMGLDLIKNFK